MKYSILIEQDEDGVFIIDEEIIYEKKINQADKLNTSHFYRTKICYNI